MYQKVKIIIKRQKSKFWLKKTKIWSNTKNVINIKNLIQYKSPPTRAPLYRLNKWFSVGFSIHKTPHPGEIYPVKNN